VDGPEGVEPPPVGEVAQGVSNRVLDDVVDLAYEDLEEAGLFDRGLGRYQSSRLPARTRAKAMGIISIPMKRVTRRSEDNPRAMGL
jgi:hypothetical protein